MPCKKSFARAKRRILSSWCLDQSLKVVYCFCHTQYITWQLQVKFVKWVFTELPFGQYFFFYTPFLGDCFVPILTPACCFLFCRNALIPCNFNVFPFLTLHLHGLFSVFFLPHSPIFSVLFLLSYFAKVSFLFPVLIPSVLCLPLSLTSVST